MLNFQKKSYKPYSIRVVHIYIYIYNSFIYRRKAVCKEYSEFDIID